MLNHVNVKTRFLSLFHQHSKFDESVDYEEIIVESIMESKKRAQNAADLISKNKDHEIARLLFKTDENIEDARSKEDQS